jgi:hypothetical protein
MTNEIIILDNKKQITPTELFTPSGIDKILADIKDQARSFVGDMSTEEGRKEIASMAYKIARTKTTLDNEGKKLTEDWSRKKSIVDSERRRVREELDSLRDEIREPLNKWEELEKKRIEEKVVRIAEIERLSTTQAFNNVSDVEKLIKDLSKLIDFNWQEFDVKAKSAHDIARIHLQKELESGLKFEEEERIRREKDIELEKLRAELVDRERKEREAQIAKEATEKAKIEAERIADIERNRVEREKKEVMEAARVREAKIESDKKVAEQAKIDAENRAKEAAEMAKVDAKKAVEDAIKRERDREKAEREAEEKALAKREANKNHQGKIHREILEDLEFYIGDVELRKSIIKAIANKKIRNLNIIY